MHGQFSWYDLMTPDAAPATKFYPAVVGWETQEWDVAAYTMWTADGEAIGGINLMTAEQAAQGVPAHWLGYVSVDDVERAAAKVTSLGGRVMHGPEDIPEVGRFAIIQDPQGAILALIHSNIPSPGYDGTAAPGKFTWHELMATDYRSAFDFYRRLFGWENLGEIDMGPVGTYLEYGMNGKMFGGIFNRRPEHGDMPNNWTFYANVKDLDKSVASLKRLGGRIAMGPMEVPGGSRVAIATDLQGAMFALHQSKARAATRSTAASSRPKAKAKAAARRPRRSVPKKKKKKRR